MTNFDLTRRGTLAGLGASAAALASGASLAAPDAAKVLLAMDDVPLAWPMYQRFASFDVPPAIGDGVTLERTGAPYSTDAITVRDLMGTRLGSVATKDAPALCWAIDQGGRVEAHIARMLEPVRENTRIPGWGHIRLSVRVEEPQGAFV